MTRGVLVALMAAVAIVWFVAARGVLWGAPPPVVRIGTSVRLGIEPLRVARDRGNLDGIDVVEFVASGQVMRAFRNGDIDAAAVSLDEALRLAADDGDLALAAVTDVSVGADAIVAHDDIVDVKGLRGRKVGVETGSVGATLLGCALDEAGVADADVAVVGIAPNEQAAALAAGRVDAVVAAEPALGALERTSGHAVFTSQQLDGEIVDVIVVRITNPTVRSRMRDAWFAAVDAARADLDTFAVAASPRMGRTPAEVRGALGRVSFVTRAESDALVMGGLRERGLELARDLRENNGAAVTDDVVTALLAVKPW